MYSKNQYGSCLHSHSSDAHADFYENCDGFGKSCEYDDDYIDRVDEFDGYYEHDGFIEGYGVKYHPPSVASSHAYGTKTHSHYHPPRSYPPSHLEHGATHPYLPHPIKPPKPRRQPYVPPHLRHGDYGPQTQCTPPIHHQTTPLHTTPLYHQLGHTLQHFDSTLDEVRGESVEFNESCEKIIKLLEALEFEQATTVECVNETLLEECVEVSECVVASRDEDVEVVVEENKGKSVYSMVEWESLSMGQRKAMHALECQRKLASIGCGFSLIPEVPLHHFEDPFLIGVLKHDDMFMSCLYSSCEDVSCVHLVGDCCLLGVKRLKEGWVNKILSLFMSLWRPPDLSINLDHSCVFWMSFMLGYWCIFWRPPDLSSSVLGTWLITWSFGCKPRIGYIRVVGMFWGIAWFGMGFSSLFTLMIRGRITFKRERMMHISERSMGQTTSQLNHPLAQKISLLSVFLCSDEASNLRNETSECPLQLPCFEFLQILGGRCSNESRHSGASSETEKEESSLKTMLLSAFLYSYNSEICRDETSKCPLQLSCFEFHLIRSGRDSKDSRHFGGSAETRKEGARGQNGRPLWP